MLNACHVRPHLAHMGKTTHSLVTSSRLICVALLWMECVWVPSLNNEISIHFLLCYVDAKSGLFFLKYFCSDTACISLMLKAYLLDIKI